MSDDRAPPDHLDSREVAAYLDHTLQSEDRARVENHLADCTHCRGEVVAVARLMHRRSRMRRWYIPLAAAAAALLLIVAPWQRLRDHKSQPVLREPTTTSTQVPVALAPLGGVAGLPAFIWSSVPHADRYRLTLFDRDGSIVWETQIAETTAVAPDTVAPGVGVPYFWKVAARTGLDRWVASDLVAFTLNAPRPVR
jgi:anti-sigma factor RsiW